jgi:DNA polymerase/3'-5' exonuclease PolX
VSTFFKAPDGVEASRVIRVLNAVYEMLEGTIEQSEIVGSLRRRSAIVGDGELLIKPKFGLAMVQEGLLEFEREVNLQFRRVNDLVAAGVLQDRAGKDGKIARGEKYQRVAFEDVAVDLFCCLPTSQWGVQMFLRTGHVEWTRPIILQSCQGGKIMPPSMYLRDGCLWKNADRIEKVKKDGREIYTHMGGEIVPTPTEESFFEAIGIEWVEPWDRAPGAEVRRLAA